MKTMKKLFALLLAVLMVMGMATTAMAASTPENYTITINNAVAGHSYAAYQIFTGKLDSTTGVLTDIQWGDGVNGETLVEDLRKSNGPGYPLMTVNDVNPFASLPAYDSTAPEVSAKAVANVMANGWSYYESEIMAFADVLTGYLTGVKSASDFTDPDKYVIEVDKTGYYLIMDEGELGTDGATDYLLLLNLPNDENTANNTNVNPKVSAPTFNKTVHHTLEGTYGKFVDSEVSDIALENIKDANGAVDTAKLNNLATSNAVWFKLEATLPSLFKNYHQYHLTFTDILPLGLKPVAGSSSGNIYLLHESGQKTTLTTEEVAIVWLDAEGNVTTDEAKLAKYKVTLDLGDIKTQLQNVTFNLDDTIVIKYAATLEPGAKLGTTDNGNQNVATMTYSNDMNQKANAVPLKTATMTSSASVYTYQATFTKVDSATKAPLGGAEFYLYRNRTATNGNLVPYYAVINGDNYITDWVENKDQATKLISSTEESDKGQFTVKGLDSLSYHLLEETAPIGYDKMKAPVLFTINAPVENQTLTGLSMTVEGTTNNGVLETGIVTGQVNNTAGKVLPTTGGIGTTIFYIVGGVLVLGAGAAFVMKKRNEA